MKKIAAVAIVFGVVSAGLTLPARAETTNPAPTNVRISWKDETFQFVRVTWDEDAPRPNRVIVRKPGSTKMVPLRMPTADEPNEVDLPAHSIWMAGPTVEVAVVVGTSTEVTSPAAVSVPFDTITEEAPEIVSYQPSGSSTLQVTWRRGTPIQQDTTPGDPLDRDLPVTYLASYTPANGTAVQIGQPTANTSITFTGPKPPFSFVVRARNEWNAMPSGFLFAGQIMFDASIPTWVTADKGTEVRGTFTGPHYAKITLQARNTPTSAWTAVASYDFTGNKYELTVPSRGTRQYRVAVTNHTETDLNQAWYGGYSAPVTTTTQLKATVSPSASTVHRSSTLVNAALTVNPATTGTASLQRWNGKTWVAVTNVAFKSGKGTGRLSAATVGTFTYRYYVPAQTFNGLPVAAAYSPNFSLKVLP